MLAEATKILKSLGVTLNVEKTRIVHVRLGFGQPVGVEDTFHDAGRKGIDGRVVDADDLNAVIALGEDGAGHR